MALAEQKPLVALHFDGEALRALDQTVLPLEERQLVLRSASDVAEAIRRLAIRGAPLIGVAAAYGLALELRHDPGQLDRACALLTGSRPTAANLFSAVERVRAVALAGRDPVREARAIHHEEEAASDAMARRGADLLADAPRLLTHCNTGALAAPGRGTALAVIAELADRHQLESVLVTETRPLLQGARLTTYELARLGIEHQLIVDAAAPGLIAGGAVDAVIVGCDRVAANGDVANKVGTYGLALAAHAAGIPLVVVGPTSTIDFSCRSGKEIVIEERDPVEVRADAPCRNPAFDITPAGLVAALVTEGGTASPVDAASVAALRRR